MKQRKEKKIKKDPSIEEVKLELAIGQKGSERIILSRKDDHRINLTWYVDEF